MQLMFIGNMEVVRGDSQRVALFDVLLDWGLGQWIEIRQCELYQYGGSWRAYPPSRDGDNDRPELAVVWSDTVECVISQRASEVYRAIGNGESTADWVMAEA